MSKQNRATPPRAFTLIELLVVISIIALLISILLPALSSARRVGQKVKCMTVIRSIAVGAIQYAGDNEDWIPGAPGGSGAYLAGAALGRAWGWHFVQERRQSLQHILAGTVVRFWCGAAVYVQGIPVHSMAKAGWTAYFLREQLLFL